MTKPQLDEAMLTDLASCSAILGTLFLGKPDCEDAKAVVSALRVTSMTEWPFGTREDLETVEKLFQSAFDDEGNSFLQKLSRDYQKLFVGPFALAAPPWGSVYLDYESVICGCSTVALQDWMRERGLVVSREHNEPEDHIGLMFMLLSWLASNRSELVPDYLELHFCTWASHFCDIMQENAATPFYQGVASLARTTLRSLCERLGLRVVEPKFYR